MAEQEIVEERHRWKKMCIRDRFGVMFLMNITDVAWLLLIAVFLYTGYGKVLNLKMKNRLNFEIPVNGMTEDCLLYTSRCV